MYLEQMKLAEAKAFIEQGDKEFLRILKIWNGLSRKLIGRMGF